MKETGPAPLLHADHGTHRHAVGGPEQAMKDPVCGMAVTDRSPHSLHHEGRPVYFCSAGCKAKFSADPARYAPRNNGWCTYAVSEGYSAEVDFVDGWSVLDGALYLNWDASVRDTFLADREWRIPAANENWPTVAAGLADGSITTYRHADDSSVGITHPQSLK